MVEQYANAVQTTLNGAILVGASSMTLTSATGVPTTGTFRALISAEGANTNEIVTVTGAAGPTYTIARATEAYAGVQAASAHGNGATVTVVLTAGGLAALPVPTLAEVLVAGATTGGGILSGVDGVMSLNNGGGVQLAGAPTDGNKTAILAASDSSGGGGGAYVLLDPGSGAVGGRVYIQTDNSTGNLGQVLTALGDGTALWQNLPNSWARW